MRERALAENITRSASYAKARPKSATRRERAPSRWSKPLLGIMAAVVTAYLQRRIMAPPRSRCADAEEVSFTLPLPPGAATKRWKVQALSVQRDFIRVYVCNVVHRDLAPVEFCVAFGITMRIKKTSDLNCTQLQTPGMRPDARRRPSMPTTWAALAASCGRTSALTRLARPQTLQRGMFQTLLHAC